MSYAHKRNTARRGRSLRMESLERRNLLAGDGFHNFIEPADVNNDEAVSAVDALTIINSLNRSQEFGEEIGSTSDSYLDVNDDGYASAVDALMVINQLNLGLASTSGDLQARFSGVAGERAKVEFEQAGQTRKLEVKVQNAAASSTLDVSINGATVGTVTTDANGRGRIELRELNPAGQPLPSVSPGDTVTITGLGSAVLSRNDDDFGIGEGDDHGIDNDDNGINDLDNGFSGDPDDGVNDIDGSSVNDRDDINWIDSDNNGINNRDDSFGDDLDVGMNDSDGSTVNDRDDSNGVDNDGNGINDLDDSFAGDLDNGVSSNQNPPIAPVTTGSLYGEWRAVLAGAGSGTAEYDRESRQSDFDLEVRGLAPNATIPVSINGTVVGQLRTDSRGQGKSKFEVGDDDYRPFPTNFPAIASGSTIQVGGSLAGTFAFRASGYDNDGHDNDDDRYGDHDDD